MFYSVLKKHPFRTGCQIGTRRRVEYSQNSIEGYWFIIPTNSTRNFTVVCVFLSVRRLSPNLQREASWDKYTATMQSSYLSLTPPPSPPTPQWRARDPQRLRNSHESARNQLCENLSLLVIKASQIPIRMKTSLEMATPMSCHRPQAKMTKCVTCPKPVLIQKSLYVKAQLSIEKLVKR